MVETTANVLKLRMVNLTVGHLRFLHELESPFTTEKEDSDTEDLILAVLVCSMRWRDAAAHIGRWYLKPFVRIWGWKCRKLNLIWEAAKFRHYISESISTKKIKKANGGKELRSPLHQRLYLMLVETLGHDPHKAWDIEVREAIDLWITRAEREGALEFYSERELAHIEIHKQMEAERQQQTRTE